MLGFLIAKAIVGSKLGKVLVAIRDAESRTRFIGYRVEAYKTFIFTVSAMMAGVAGALYVPQVGIINPSEFQPANSIEMVIWVAAGRPRHAFRRGDSARSDQLPEDDLHDRVPCALLAVCTGRHLYPGHVFMPKGIIGTLSSSRGGVPKRKSPSMSCLNARPAE